MKTFFIKSFPDGLSIKSTKVKLFLHTSSYGRTYAHNYLAFVGFTIRSFPLFIAQIGFRISNQSRPEIGKIIFI